MRIEIVGARNFLTLENFEIALSANYCAISGQNNAGKTALTRVLRHFFDDRDDDGYWGPGENRISFARDYTQWAKSGDLEIWTQVSLSELDDSEVMFVVKTYSSKEVILGDTVSLKVHEAFNEKGARKFTCHVGGAEVEGQGAEEILKKLRSASNLFVYNSTQPARRMYYRGDSFTEVVEAQFSSDDRKKIADAEKVLQNRVKKAAKQHKDDLDAMLGRLAGKYQVELTAIDRGRSSRFPLEIKLNDRTVDVPLNAWGAGTQNRTRVIMAIMDAVRFRDTVSSENRSTPVFLVEEPESFLHPSAQAEFGQFLNSLADELSIQIIATTHSPYMLNQKNPEANFLLERKEYRGTLRETFIRETDGKSWMVPFAENLGIVPTEFSPWESVFKSNAGRVIFVEGEIDRKYFEHFRENYPDIYGIPDDVEIVPYDGAGALKNTSILKFMVRKFSKVFITFDLDCVDEAKISLERIGLKEGDDFCAIGVAKDGCENIEGLLPSTTKQAVFARDFELVSALTSQNTKARNSAKSTLKNKLLDEFRDNPTDPKNLNEFKKLFATIKKPFT